MVAPEPSTNRHHHSCRCNRCVARRNARRRADEARTTLPPMSQIFEIERDLPPVYVDDVEPQRTPESARLSRLMEAYLADLPSRRPAITSTRPAKKRMKQRTKRFITIMVAILVLTLVGVLAWWQGAQYWSVG